VGLNYKLARAERIRTALTSDERRRLDRICADIREAEARLSADSAHLMAGCLKNCKGLCCRNAAFDDIIGLADFVYILNGAPRLKDRMKACLADEKPFFTADCPFLAEGRGPCIFADDIRPEVCITTFCADTSGLRGDISRVRRGFAALNRFLMLHRLRAAWCRVLHFVP
jgi:hypothetical protein